MVGLQNIGLGLKIFAAWLFTIFVFYGLKMYNSGGITQINHNIIFNNTFMVRVIFCMLLYISGFVLTSIHLYEVNKTLDPKTHYFFPTDPLGTEIVEAQFTVAALFYIILLWLIGKWKRSEGLI